MADGDDVMHKDSKVERKISEVVDDDDSRVKPSTRPGLPPNELDYSGAKFGDDGSTEIPEDESAASEGRASGTLTDVSSLILVAATIGVTFVLVVVILSIIVRLLRGQKPPPPQPPPPPTSSRSTDREVEIYSKNSIKQRHRNGTLYYTPPSTNCLSAPTSQTQLDLTNPPSGPDGTKSVGEIASLLQSTTNSRDVVSRSASSGEPLRMYKWEDF